MHPYSLSNTWFPGPTQACPTTGISNSRSVFALQGSPMRPSHRRTDTQTSTQITICCRPNVRANHDFYVGPTPGVQRRAYANLLVGATLGLQQVANNKPTLALPFTNVMAQRRPDVISQHLPYYLPTYFQLLDLRWRFTVGLYPYSMQTFYQR